MKRFRWLGGGAAAAALAVAVVAITAGAGAARTAAAPSNTQPPQIKGNAQVGETLSTDNGTWNNSPTSYDYQWRICGNNGGSCHDIAGATTDHYYVNPNNKGNTIRVAVTAKNADGSASAASVPTAVIAAAPATTPTPAPTPAPTPSSNGCPKMAAGASSVAVADVSAPARLQVDQIQSSPGTITGGTQVFTVRFHVSDTCGDPVSGAQVYATGVPYNMITIPSQQQTGSSGWVSMQFRTLSGFPATPKQELLVMFVRASEPNSKHILAGISTRRLISLHVNLHA